MDRKQWALGFLTFAAVLCVASFASAATGGGTWGAGPLQQIQSEIQGASGPIAVIALAGGGVGLMFGRDFGQLAHVASYVALVAGMVGGVASLALGGAVI